MSYVFRLSGKVDLDARGIWAALLCALHGLLLPVLLPLIPLSRLKFVSEPLIEIVINLFAVFIAAHSLTASYSRFIKWPLVGNSGNLQSRLRTRTKP